MMRLLLSTLLLLAACAPTDTEDKNQPPTSSPKIAKEPMAAVLADIHLAEAMLSAVSNRVEKDSLASVYYSQILQIHQLQAADFEQSMQVYFRNPKLLGGLYEQILADLQQKTPRR